MSMKALVLLALAGSVSLTFLMLSCVLPQFGVYWTLFVLMFYFMTPIPIFIARRYSNDGDSASTACKEIAFFFTTGIVISAFGLPAILAHVGAIQWGACAFVLAGNVIAFLTILGFFMYFTQESDYDFQRW
uniref:Leptin receptor gene-related protein n=1 Tax=Ciona savignyi TaxID=51511 RepID=H2YYL8_CIOSA